MAWSPDQYRQFEAERNRPARDLIARVPHLVARGADLGCGPGNSTELLLERFPDAAVVGVDSSPDMVAAARERLPGVRFEVADLGAWPDPGPFDLILANASLQWVPDHAALLPRLLAKLAPGGRLAVQVPDNLDEPAHRMMRETAAAGPWAAKLATAAAAREGRHHPGLVLPGAAGPRGRGGRVADDVLPPARGDRGGGRVVPGDRAAAVPPAA